MRAIHLLPLSLHDDEPRWSATHTQEAQFCRQMTVDRLNPQVLMIIIRGRCVGVEVEAATGP